VVWDCGSVDIFDVIDVGYKDVIVHPHGKELPEKIKQRIILMFDHESLAGAHIGQCFDH
jgi:hypothetical protein